jgi:acetyl esterase/lipase
MTLHRLEARGTLVSVTTVDEIGADQVTAYLAKAKLPVCRARYGVRAVRIEYRTITPDGRPTVASGLVVLPLTSEKSLQAVSWLHGTTVNRNDVASVKATNENRAFAVLFAAAGYLTSAPDYLGLGTGPGDHPYLDLASEVTASVDALRATRELAAREGIEMDERVLVSGFSQGGAAAMALGKALQEGADPGLKLAALAPISGPYDVQGMLDAVFSGAIDRPTTYLGYWIVAWNKLHNLYDSPADAFLDPSVEQLFDGDHHALLVYAKLPATLEELFTPAFLAQLKKPTGTLSRVIRESGRSHDWEPRVPVRLFAASGDRDVPMTNTDHCERVLRSCRTDVETTDVGAVDHNTSAKVSVPQVLAVFEELAA